MKPALDATIDSQLARLERELLNGEPLALLRLMACTYSWRRPFPESLQRRLGRAATLFLKDPSRDLAALLGVRAPSRGKSDPVQSRAERERDEALRDALELLQERERLPIGEAANRLERALARARIEFAPGVKVATLQASTIRKLWRGDWRARPRVRSKAGLDLYLIARDLPARRSRSRRT